MEKYSLPWALERFHNTEGWMHEEEGILLYNLAKEVGGIVIEIGSYKGKSTVMLAAGVWEHGTGLRTVTSIDPHAKPDNFKVSQEYDIWEKEQYNSSWDEFNANLKKNEIKNIVGPIRKTSEQLMKEWKERKLELIVSLLFIDGCHERKYVQMDFDLYSPLVRQGGYIAFHDAAPGNADFNESAGIVAEKEIIKSGKYEWGRCKSIVYGKKK